MRNNEKYRDKNGRKQKKRESSCIGIFDPYYSVMGCCETSRVVTFRRSVIITSDLQTKKCPREKYDGTVAPSYVCDRDNTCVHTSHAGNSISASAIITFILGSLCIFIRCFRLHSPDFFLLSEGHTSSYIASG